jgi:hypothetical protein
MSCLCSPDLSDAIVTPTGAASFSLANIYNICFKFPSQYVQHLLYSVTSIINLTHMLLYWLEANICDIWTQISVFLIPASHCRKDFFSSFFQEIHHYQLKRGTRVLNRNYLSLNRCLQ